MLTVLKEMMNFKLLADPLFFMIGISNVFGMIGFYTPFVYLPSMAAQYVSWLIEIRNEHLTAIILRTISVSKMLPFLCPLSVCPTPLVGFSRDGCLILNG